MSRPSTTISPKKFKLTGPRNQHFKVWGSDMDAWNLSDVQLSTTGPYVWTVDSWNQNPNFVQIFANPASTAITNPAPTAIAKAPTGTSGDLTITLTFDDPSGGTDDIVEECDDIEYEP
jgi:hypothetical protein